MTENISKSNIPSETKEMNILNRIIGVFTSPGEAFHAIVAKPKWIVPGIILYVLTIGTNYYMRPVTIKEEAEIKEKVFEKMNVPEERRIEEREKDKKASSNLFAFLGKTTFGFAFKIAALSAILLFIANIIVGGLTNYGQQIGVYIYSSFIPVIGNLIKLPIIISKNTLNVHFSFATFLPETLRFKFGYLFLSQLDLFNIWFIICLSIGVGVAVKKGAKSVWPWITLLYLLIYAGLSAIASFFAG